MWNINDTDKSGKPVEILLIEDNPSDMRLTQELIKESKLHNNLHVATDGEEAMAFLRQEGHCAGKPRPDLILLDINLPKKDGREVLAEIKADEKLKVIPVVILSSSESEEDVRMSYERHANCYVTKPLYLEQFFTVVNFVNDSWFSIVKLPSKVQV